MEIRQNLHVQAGQHSKRLQGSLSQTLATEIQDLESKMVARLSIGRVPLLEYICRWLGFERIQSTPDARSELTDIKWLCELALKRFDAADRAFDVINNRTGVVIGFAGLFNSLLLSSWQKLPFPARYLSGVVWGSLLALMLYNSLRAFQVTDVDNLPLKRSTADSFLSLSEEDARERWLANLLDAAERMENANNLKASYLREAIRYLGLQVATLLGIILVAGVS